jgi:hypothetical protein
MLIPSHFGAISRFGATTIMSDNAECGCFAYIMLTFSTRLKLLELTKPL